MLAIEFAHNINHVTRSMPSIKRTSTELYSVPSSTPKRRRSNSVSGYPKKPKKMKTYGQEGPEVKFYDTTIIPAFFSSTAAVYDMSTMAQGLTNTTRIGNKIRIISAAVNMQYELNLGVSTLPNHAKWSIVLDKEPEQAAIASYNQIYAGQSPLQMRNINYSDRFKVLATGDFSQPGNIFQPDPRQNQDAQCCSTGMVRAFKKCDINSKFVLTTATQTAVGSNQLLFCVAADVSDQNWLYNAICRIRYTDE